MTMYKSMMIFLSSLFIILSIQERSFEFFMPAAVLLVVCNLSNFLFAKIFKARINIESASITSLIIFFIVWPMPLPKLLLIGVLAMLSKYLLAFRRKHIFNPAAVAVLISALFFGAGASWWAGGKDLLPFIVAGGVLVLIKIKRIELALSFLVTYFLLTQRISFSPSLWFFVLVMLIEPLTSPSTKKGQITFGILVALSYFGLGKLFPTYSYGLETSLLIGNAFSFLTTTSFNSVATFIKKEQVAQNTWTFYFKPKNKFNFKAGQYLEWTFWHNFPDLRGIRRFFTISSSPTEEFLAVTMRTNEKGSSYKKALLQIESGKEIGISNPQGDFVLPQETTTKLAFIAGGIGITPFRSMVKELIDRDEKRDIVILYSCKTDSDVAFKELLESASTLGIKTYFVLTDVDGYIDQKLIETKIPDFKERAFYISGPEKMVSTFKNILNKMKVSKIKTDYFPGY